VRRTELPEPQKQQCLICSGWAAVRFEMLYRFVDCPRCGNFQVERSTADDVPLPLGDANRAAAASFAVRKLQGDERIILDKSFFESLADRSLPTAPELSDNLLLHIAKTVDGRPGRPISIDYNNDTSLIGAIGALNLQDVLWATRNLDEEGLLKGQYQNHFSNGYLTAEGWRRVGELERSHVASKFAFFARQFNNPDLDTLFAQCLKPAVAQTGYDLRTVTQKAGHIDAIIEDEIRRCRFLIADLSDDNAGAYWEAGLAEGLGKPVIYIAAKRLETELIRRHTSIRITARQFVGIWGRSTKPQSG
jgi:hypothetical protein